MMSFVEVKASELYLVEREILIQAIDSLLLLKLISDKYKVQEIYEKVVNMKG